LCNKILNAECKRDKYFVDEVETLIKRKTTPRQPNSGNPLIEEIASYKAVILTYP
jgi:hypothetical protein